MLLDALELAAVAVKRNVPAMCAEVPELKGHADAVIILDADTYVLEIKTTCASNFTLCARKGVRQWRSQYYDQIMLYMGMFGLSRGMFLVINKDTSELYEELVEFDSIHYEMLVEKARWLVRMTDPPPRISESKMFYVCKMCKFKGVCHDNLS